jgi:hypothetical protein
LTKGKDGINDLDAPLAASAGRPIGNNATKTNTLEAMWTKKIQSSINKCIVDVSLNLLIRDKKDEEWWATLLQKQEEKMRIKKERVVVKKHREYLMLLTASTAGMDPRVLTADNFYKAIIFDEIDAKIVVHGISINSRSRDRGSISKRIHNNISQHACVRIEENTCVRIN